MKLLLVTSVEEFHNDIIQMFKESKIESFSESEIGGHKKNSSVLVSTNWFASEKSGTNSIMLFSFTEEDKIDSLFNLLEEFNNNMETKNPVKAVVIPIERSL